MLKPEEFDLRVAVVLGSAVDLTERASALLNVNRRTVIRWQAGMARIPDGVEEELRRRTGSRHDLMFRHGLDRWLISLRPSRKGRLCAQVHCAPVAAAVLCQVRWLAGMAAGCGHRG